MLAADRRRKPPKAARLVLGLSIFAVAMIGVQYYIIETRTVGIFGLFSVKIDWLGLQVCSNVSSSPGRLVFEASFICLIKSGFSMTLLLVLS